MSVLRPSAHSTTTSPPRPPSPPSGPPNSMNFSRRNETAPAPPSPERMYTRAESRNFIAVSLSRDAGQSGRRFAPPRHHACPIRPGESEAVALDHATARRGALQPRADEGKPALLQHSFGGLVLDPDAGQDLDRRRQPEGRVDHGFGGFGRETLAPSLRGQRIAEHKSVPAARFEADRPDGVALALDWRHHQGQVASGGVCFARSVNEPLGRAWRIGMGNAGGV